MIFTGKSKSITIYLERTVLTPITPMTKKSLKRSYTITRSSKADFYTKNVMSMLFVRKVSISLMSNMNLISYSIAQAHLY